MSIKIKNIKIPMLIFAMLFASLWSLTCFTPLANATTRNVTKQVTASKDAYVDAGYPASNYGGQSYFYVGKYSGSWKELYLQFDTTNPPAGWTQAEIWIDFSYLTATLSLNASLVMQAWDEYTLTWSNKPAYGMSIAQVLAISSSILCKVNVTSFISGNSISLCLNASDTSQTAYASGDTREYYYNPSVHLVWTYPEEASITVTSPSSDSRWTYMSSQVITWTSIGTIPYVKVQLYKGDLLIDNYTLSSTTNDGSMSVTVEYPVNSEGDDYRIKISDAADPSVYDYSDNFSIVSRFSIPGYDVWLIAGFLLGTVALIALNLRRSVDRRKVIPS